MKILQGLIIVILATACNNQSTTETVQEDTSKVKEVTTKPVVNDTVIKQPAEPKTDVGKTYANARFKNVTVTKTGVDEYLIKGQGQIFEAAFSWVVEDGHNELKKGFEMTDAGAPEWGNFSFKINVPKQSQHSTLHLILFEISAKDGSRQHELIIPL